MSISWRNCGIFLVVVILISCLVPIYWVYIPALVDWIIYPAPISNYEVQWTERPPIDSRPRSTNSKPNLIVILADDLGYNDITFHGKGFANGRIHTPNIDSIGHLGASFSNAYAGQGTCAPSRASLLTGRFPTTIGYEFTPVTASASYAISMLGYSNLPGIFHSDLRNYVNETAMVLPINVPTFGEVFQKEGKDYRTLFLGKWHNGNTPEFHAITRGFDEKLAINIISSYLPVGHPDSVDCELDDSLDRFLRANIRYQIEKDYGPYFEPKGYITDYLGDEAVRAIKANKDHPFLMYLSFTAPHTPLQALKTDYETLNQYHDMTHCEKVYGSMLISLDRAVGNVLNALKTLGLSDNTLVIFSSDNGSPSYVNLRHTNHPYRGWKASHFEGGIKVPLLMKWPNMIPAGVKLDDIVSHVDIFSTIINAAGISQNAIDDSAPLERQLDGINLLPLIQQQQQQQQLHSKSEIEIKLKCDENIVCENEINDCDEQNNTSKFTGHEYLFWRSGHVTTLRTSEWKIQVAARPNKMWLYHLKEDPTERVNLAYDNQYQTDLTRMLKKLHFVNSTQSPPLWPALSECPVLIDKIATDSYEEGDEYVYWPN